VERLLVIDDSKEARDFLQDFLGDFGYSVLTARDGEEGLRRALNEDPDVILLDMQMPKMTGLEVIKALNQEGLDIPVIFLTVHGSEDLAVQAFRLGARDYVPKPYEPQVILESVERALHGVRLRKERDQLTEELLQANQTLQRQLQEINALYAIGKSVTSLLDVEQVLSRVVEAAVFMAQAEEGSLMLLDEPGGELYLRAAKNIDEKVARGLRLRVDDSLVGRVVNTGKPVLLAGEGLKKISTAYLVKTLLIVPLHIPERGVIGVLMVTNKVSDRVFSEHDLHLLSTLADFAAVAIDNASLVTSLRMEKGKLETILRETDDAVLVVDEQERILLCNRTARRAFDLGGRDVVGRPVHEFINNPELLDLLDRPRQSSPSLHTDVPLADGRTLNAHISTISGVGYAVVMQDITHLKELDRVKSEFVSTVSHDLRTPLTSIQGYIDLLPRVGPLNEQQEKFISRVQRSLSAVTDLVGDLLDIGRIEAGFDLDMVRTDLEPVIIEAVAELRPEAETKKHSLQVHVPVDLSPIRGNPRRLRQVIGNLVSNAIKYTSPEGNIAVEASEGDSHVKISVTDDGIGIPLADQPYVFDKFFRVDAAETLNVPGTGLGLSIVKSVVEKHGGRVWVESAPGEGSTFTVLLPKR
jgi:two-component system phosphate regulon sensor histidine kinase PhoR